MGFGWKKESSVRQKVRNCPCVARRAEDQRLTAKGYLIFVCQYRFFNSPTIHHRAIHAAQVFNLQTN